MDDSPGTPTRIILASRNPGKLSELAAILAGLPFELLSAGDAGAPEVEETGDTFEENAVLKARAVAEATGLLAIADDSGLVVPALDGAPGIRSARYSAAGTAEANNEKLLAELRRRSLDHPAARFVCVIALASPRELRHVARGEVEGVILPEPRGRNGFGYDPLFYCPEIGRTFAEASPAVKASVSHRGRAVRMLHEFLAPSTRRP